MSNLEMESQETEGFLVRLKALGTMLKLVGFAVLGIILCLIVLFGIFNLGFNQELSFGLIGSIVLIGIGTVMERLI